MGLEVLERLRFLASLPLAGTEQTEGRSIRVANNRIISHPFKTSLHSRIQRKVPEPPGGGLALLRAQHVHLGFLRQLSMHLK